LKRFGPENYKSSIFNIPIENMYNKLETNTFVQMIEEFAENNAI